MGEAFLDKNGSGMKINGIIEDYYVYAGENISTGSFVEFVNGVAGQTTTTISPVIISDQSNSANASALLLNSGDVLLVYQGGTATNSYMYATVISISGNTITKGTETQLTTTVATGTRRALILLSDGTVFIAYGYGTSYYLYGMVVSINGKTITVNINKSISTTANRGWFLSGGLLSNNKILLISPYGSSYYLYANVITVSTTKIDSASILRLSSETNSGQVSQCVSLGNDKFFVAHKKDANGALNGAIVSVSGTTISYGTNGMGTQLSSVNGTADHLAVVKMSDTKVFVAHSIQDGTNEFSLGGVIATISDKKITPGTDVELDTTYYSGYNLSAVKLQNGNVLATHCYSDTSHMRGTAISVSGTTPSKITSTEMHSTSTSSHQKSALILLGNSLFSTYSVSYYLRGQMFEIDGNIPKKTTTTTTYETQVRNVTSFNANGIAKTSGVGGSSTAHNETVQIYVPNI